MFLGEKKGGESNKGEADLEVTGKARVTKDRKKNKGWLLTEAKRGEKNKKEPLRGNEGISGEGEGGCETTSKGVHPGTGSSEMKPVGSA